MDISQVLPGDRAAIRRFIEFAFRLYKGQELWVPPLVGDLRSYLTRKHPFFDHSDAAFFLAWRDGKVVGRIAAIENRAYNGHHGTNTAFFGFFECIDDEAVASGLLDAASVWARERGLSSILGPKGFVRSAGTGLLVEGFDQFPALGIAWNFPYYDRLLTKAGFTKTADYLSGWLDRSARGDERLYRVAEIARKRGNFAIRAFDSRRELQAVLPAVKRIQHEAFADNPNYVPSTDAEFDLMAKTLIFVADLSIVRFIEKDGEIAGFMNAYPNLGRGFQKARGRLWPLGWLYILLERSRSLTLDLNGIGILPRYQKQGGDAILFTELEQRIRASRYEKVDFIQVNEDNFLSKSGIEHFKVAWAKRHRVYRRDILDATSDIIK
ncbi:MAG: hypothetical protein A3J97_15155 [Spirochaetes bacterium RIFOXYC1_FULL_54_7]|nr:MAG: hypothetical protein A3J97_15155 [Spirochaetes bacterium RIFOXYC1_FULL_54_7]